MTAGALASLVGPRFDRLLADAAGGAPLLLRARRADTLDLMLERARTGPLMLETQEVADAGGSAADLLLSAARNADPAIGDLEQLVAAPALRYAMLIARTAPATAPGWMTLAGLFASLRDRHAGAGPALVVVADAPAAPAGCQLFDDGDLVGPAECALIARWHRGEAGLIAAAADAAAIEVARGDVGLLARLLDLGDVERLDPRAWIARQPAAGDPRPLIWRGAEAPCPRWLVDRDTPALRRRVWRGHLGVLLPWLEEQRAALIGRIGGALAHGMRDRETGEPLAADDLEWGHILTALRSRQQPQAAAAADVLRRVRNALAHGDPAPLDDCRRMENAARLLAALR